MKHNYVFIRQVQLFPDFLLKVCEVRLGTNTKMRQCQHHPRRYAVTLCNDDDDDDDDVDDDDIGFVL